MSENLETEFDEIKSVFSAETYYHFNILNHVSFPKEKESMRIINDDESDSMPNILLSFMHYNSHDDDSNNQSKDLVNNYRNNLMKN